MNNLKLYRKKKGVSQAEVSEVLGLSPAAYGHYESGRRMISAEYLEKLADYYGVSTDDLLGRSPDNKEWKEIQEIPELVPEAEVMIPLVASLRCGPGQPGEPFCVIKPIGVPASYVKRWGEDIQAIMAVGESMSPTIIPGDMLVCKPGAAWENGNVVSVNVDDNDMVKRIYRTKDGGIDLRSDNKKYDTIHFTAADLAEGRVHVLGRVMIPIPKEL